MRIERPRRCHLYTLDVWRQRVRSTFEVTITIGQVESEKVRIMRNEPERLLKQTHAIERNFVGLAIEP